jgi:hypothetical protein
MQDGEFSMKETEKNNKLKVLLENIIDNDTYTSEEKIKIRLQLIAILEGIEYERQVQFL